MKATTTTILPKASSSTWTRKMVRAHATCFRPARSLTRCVGDVFDEENAYLEMLAKEVRSRHPPSRALTHVIDFFRARDFEGRRPRGTKRPKKMCLTLSQTSKKSSGTSALWTA